MSRYLGITRERVYSPGKVADDRAIIEAVAERLSLRHEVRVADGDAAMPEVSPDTVVFAMCQGPAALAVLHRWHEAGLRITNTPAAIENCHRRRMLPAFERCGVDHPRSELLSTEPGTHVPEWMDAGGWVKRGDVHATESRDVVRVASRRHARAVLDDFRHRGVGTALVQLHVEGAVMKFYAVGDQFFECAEKSPAPEMRDSMAALARRGATALGLEVFGGDLVRDGKNRLWLIDLNDWPSYAPVRADAASAISMYLEGQEQPTLS